MGLTAPIPIELVVSDEGPPTDEKFSHFAKDGSFCTDAATGKLYVRVAGEWREIALVG